MGVSGIVDMATQCVLRWFLCFVIALVGASEAQRAPEEGYEREQLQALTKFRQQHRRTIDGRLCAAAFVQDRRGVGRK